MGLTNIQWTDYTFNPWLGCRKVAHECLNCYIVTTPPFRFRGLTHGAVRIRTVESTWKQPLAWDRKAAENQRIVSLNAPGLSEDGKAHYAHRPRVFCLSLGDWLDDENVPIEWLSDLLRLIWETPNLDWLLLTKRPQNWSVRIGEIANIRAEGFGMKFSKISSMAHEWISGHPPHNVWIGVSAGADQAAALAIPAKIHFLSCEPMLHELDTTHASRFNWIIFGGESGKNARGLNTDWIRDGIKFCRNHCVAPFVKQMGAASRLDLKDSHGGNMDEWPEDLRVREFPTETGLMTPRA